MLNNKKKAKKETEVSENQLKMLKAPAIEVSKLEEPIEMPKLEKPTERLKLEMKENVPLKKKSRKRMKK
ncbi:MAG TPA: hypothetical protein VJY36_07125 [Candidatus Bathyarchaeia archaeon]|nr:hypothetical protein [Candidatus Bathyarchaeia archaeon]